MVVLILKRWLKLEKDQVLFIYKKILQLNLCFQVAFLFQVPLFTENKPKSSKSSAAEIQIWKFWDRQTRLVVEILQN